MSQTHTLGEWMAVVCTVPTDRIAVGDLLVIGKAQPGYGNSDGDGVICIVSPHEHVTDEDRANAERIVLCCNAHDDLVAALRACAETLRAIRMCYGFGSSKAITPQTQLALEGEIDKSLEPCRAALAALAKAGEK